MTTARTSSSPPALETDHDDASPQALSTQRAYTSDWRQFTSWAADHGATASVPVAPDVVVLYLTELAGFAKISTIARRLAAIASVHRGAGHLSPTQDMAVQAVWAGIRQEGTTPKQASSIGRPVLRQMLDCLPNDLLGIRDRALLLTAFAAALGRSELVALDAEDLDFRKEGLVLKLRRLRGPDRFRRLPNDFVAAICPVRALSGWVNESEIATGALFRPVDRHGHLGSGRLSAAGANRAIQRAVARTGLNPGSYSAHSLKKGLAANPWLTDQ